MKLSAVMTKNRYVMVNFVTLHFLALVGKIKSVEIVLIFLALHWGDDKKGVVPSSANIKQTLMRSSQVTLRNR